MVDRAAFVKRIADALIRGERKLGRVRGRCVTCVVH